MDNFEFNKIIQKLKNSPKHNVSDKKILALEQMSIKNKEHWADPAYKDKRKLSHSKAMAKPEVRAKFSQAISKNTGINSPEAQLKKKQTKINKNLSGYKDSSYWEEIYWLFWNENRNNADYRKEIGKKYGISQSTLHTLVNGASGMNVSESIKDSHDSRLLAWQKQYGDLRYIYTIITNDGHEYEFDSLADAGKWFCQSQGKTVKVSNSGRINYGNTVFAYFKYNIPCIKKGKYKGWSFLQRERKS